MEFVKVQGETRQAGGRHANQRLRRRGLVPAVIYGHREQPETIALSLHDVQVALEHLQHVIELKVDGPEQCYLIKDVQYDHLQKTPLHVDLMRVDVNERVHVKVPLELKGSPKGTHEGGVLVHVLADITVECLLVAIPEFITTNVVHLSLGDTLRIKDLSMPPDIKPVHDPDEIVAVVRVPRGTHVEEVAAAAPAEGAEEAPQEPEVFGRTAKEKAEDEGEG